MAVLFSYVSSEDSDLQKRPACEALFRALFRLELETREGEALGPAFGSSFGFGLN